MLVDPAVMKAKAPREEVKRFIGEHANNPTKLQLLLFWSRHPNAKFTLRTLKSALNEHRVGEIEHNLEDLTRSGLVKKHVYPKGGIFFSLAGVREKQSLVLELSKWSRYDIRYCFGLPEIGTCTPAGSS